MAAQLQLQLAQPEVDSLMASCHYHIGYSAGDHCFQIYFCNYYFDTNLYYYYYNHGFPTAFLAHQMICTGCFAYFHRIGSVSIVFCNRASNILDFPSSYLVTGSADGSCFASDKQAANINFGMFDSFMVELSDFFIHHFVMNLSLKIVYYRKTTS